MTGDPKMGWNAGQRPQLRRLGYRQRAHEVCRGCRRAKYACAAGIIDRTRVTSAGVKGCKIAASGPAVALHHTPPKCLSEGRALAHLRPTYFVYSRFHGDRAAPKISHRPSRRRWVIPYVVQVDDEELLQQPTPLISL